MHDYVIRPTIADIVNDLQLIKLVEIMKTKSSESPLALASLLSSIKHVLVKPYFPRSIFGRKKTLVFTYNGGNYTVKFVKCASSPPEDCSEGESESEADPNTTNDTNRSSSVNQIIQPSIGDIVSDDQFPLFVQIFKEKAKESPRKLATILAAIKVILDEVDVKAHMLQSKTRFVHGDEEYVADLGDEHQQNENNHNSNNGFRIPFPVQQHHQSQGPLVSNAIANGGTFDGTIYGVPQEVHHEHDEDMDELEKDDIVVEGQTINSDMWRHANINLQPSHHHPHHNTIIPLNKRKRASSANSEEDNFIHHTAPNAQSAKRRPPEKHKAPPLSCEAVKRLFFSISKATLLQRLEESKTLIATIKETYNRIQQSSNPASTSPRLNLLCHLLQSPPTSRIDGISSKVFSNLELYKLFTTYNAYKDELMNKNHSENSSNTQNKRNNTTSTASTDQTSLPYPTYSSFIDPTVTLHIKDQTGGKEVGKHRLNCAWRLSILCELLGKGVLLMTKELSGAKLERILVEEFSKLIEFLKNPDNNDWVTTVREKLDLVGFDEVYAPLAESVMENGNNPLYNVGAAGLRTETVNYVGVVDPVLTQETSVNELGIQGDLGIMAFDEVGNGNGHVPSRPNEGGGEVEEDGGALTETSPNGQNQSMQWMKTEPSRRF